MPNVIWTAVFLIAFIVVLMGLPLVMERLERGLDRRTSPLRAAAHRPAAAVAQGGAELSSQPNPSAGN